MQLSPNLKVEQAMSQSSADYGTPQEEFWAGQFGNEYIQRNNETKHLSSNLALFSKILSRTGPIETAIEFGANIGLNLRAIHKLSPQTHLTAVEINNKACQMLNVSLPEVQLTQASILDVQLSKRFDLALIKGVLIHINPENLPVVYSKLEEATNRFTLIAEYYNPCPVKVDYHGHSDRLYKRDFAGEFLDRYTDFKVLDYGFCWHRDPIFPQDDITWFLLERRGT